MTTELWWAIGVVVALFVLVRWGLPALGWRRDCRDGICPTKGEKSAAVETPAVDDDRWSKTERFTETTIQLPPDER
jgi:hypothetical protein